MTWDPDSYAATIRAEIARYDELQERVVGATIGTSVGSILDLGVGSGETAARVVAAHPSASLVGVDSSAEMLGAAQARLPAETASFVRQDLSDPLPPGTFDLIVSALAIHHLAGDRKRDLFGEVAGHLSPTGLFVMGDVIVPEDPSEAEIELEDGYDFPSPLSDLVAWLGDSGLEAEIVWVQKDLAVLRSTPSRTRRPA